MKKIGWSATIVATICILLFPIGIAEVGDPEGGYPEMPTVIEFNDIEIGVDTLMGESNQIVINDITFVWDEDPPSGDSGYAGCVESLNTELFAYSQPFVHTYNDESPPPYVAHVIDCDVFVEELRSGRELAYLIIPTMSIYADGEWIDGPVLGGMVVWENDTFHRTYVGRYGVGVITVEDGVTLYRNNIFYYLEVYRGPNEIRFELTANESSPAGIWFRDVYPYFYDYRIKIADNVQIDKHINSEILEMALSGSVSQ